MTGKQFIGPEYVRYFLDGVQVSESVYEAATEKRTQTWAESTCEVIHDGTGHFQEGQRLIAHVVGPRAFGSRSHVGRNWRMPLLKPEDVKYAYPHTRA